MPSKLASPLTYQPCSLNSIGNKEAGLVFEDVRVYYKFSEEQLRCVDVIAAEIT